jgi:hypothetical protein
MSAALGLLAAGPHRTDRSRDDDHHRLKLPLVDGPAVQHGSMRSLP